MFRLVAVLLPSHSVRIMLDRFYSHTTEQAAVLLTLASFRIQLGFQKCSIRYVSISPSAVHPSRSTPEPIDAVSNPSYCYQLARTACMTGAAPTIIISRPEVRSQPFLVRRGQIRFAPAQAFTLAFSDFGAFHCQPCCRRTVLFARFLFTLGADNITTRSDR